MTSQISVRLSEELNAMLTEYTNRKGLTKVEFIRGVLTEKLEDEDDILIANKSFEEWIRNGKRTESFEEMMKDYG